MEEQYKSKLINKQPKIQHVSKSSGAIFTSDGKLVIKLKNTKVEQEFVQENNNNNQIHACQYCFKEFSSAKALGGHMRVHGDDKKTEQSRLESAPSTPSSETNRQRFENPTCSLCGKNFPSMKALFGHMRCHPERDWRGIQPPPPAPVAGNSQTSSVSDDDQVDLMQFMTGWSVTGRRGRTATAPVTETSSEEEDEDFHIAAGELLLLAQEKSRNWKVDETEYSVNEETGDLYRDGGSKISWSDEEWDTRVMKIKISKTDPNRIIHGSKRKIIEDSPLKIRKIDEIKHSVAQETGDSHESKIRVKKMKNSKNDQNRIIHGSKTSLIEDSPLKTMKIDETEYSVAKETGDLYTDENIRVKKKKKKMKLTTELAEFSPLNLNPIDSAERYKCSTCNKCFTSHQALGGHRSSHNKFKIITINTMDESSSAADQDQYHNNNQNFPVTHQCKICNKIFNTGQALGGHQRRHWPGPAGQSESNSEPNRLRRMSVEFDLNEVPNIDDYGDYALSSYNSN